MAGWALVDSNLSCHVFEHSKIGRFESLFFGLEESFFLARKIKPITFYIGNFFSFTKARHICQYTGHVAALHKQPFFI